MRLPKQLSLAFHPARRRRRARSKGAGVPHRPRAPHCHRQPLHVTLRRADLLPSMREEGLFLALRRALSRTARAWFRVVQFSVQANHVHMIVEAQDAKSLARGITGLCVRLARAFNAKLDRRGGLWAERYHARALTTPREVRNALIYVLMNRRKHAAAAGRAALDGFDACSSAWWFDGWTRPPSCGPPIPAEVAPVVVPLTWLARTGWKRHGPIRADESPKAAMAR